MGVTMGAFADGEKDDQYERVNRSARLKLSRIGVYVAPAIVGTLELSPLAVETGAVSVACVDCVGREHRVADRG